MSIQSSISKQAAPFLGTEHPMPVKKSRKAANKTLNSKVEVPSSDAIYISDHTSVENHRDDVGIIGGVHKPSVTQCISDTAELISDITYLWRLRQRWHKAEKSLILQGKALCRSKVPEGDKKLATELFDRVVDEKETETGISSALQPFLLSIEHFQSSRKGIEKELVKMARKLPAYDWIKSVHGIGDGGYASIVGEAGDITKYKSVAALWKRMGLAVIEGGRQRCVSNAEDALIHGYNPSRRSVMWCVGTNLIGSLGVGRRPEIDVDLAQYDWPPYQKLFVERCRYLVEKDPEKYGRGTTEKADKTTGEVILKESYSKHCAASAKRYVEKRFLRDLYAEWNKNRA
jgi:hypothetical protein